MSADKNANEFSRQTQVNFSSTIYINKLCKKRSSTLNHIFWYSFQILNGNTDQNTVKEVPLYKHVVARFLRFRPETWTGSICMRVEAYGCEGWWKETKH